MVGHPTEVVRDWDHAQHFATRLLKILETQPQKGVEQSVEPSPKSIPASLLQHCD
jgi:hypothetical protein